MLSGRGPTPKSARNPRLCAIEDSLDGRGRIGHHPPTLSACIFGWAAVFFPGLDEIRLESAPLKYRQERLNHGFYRIDPGNGGRHLPEDGAK
ncbi:MAG: hypothetical protein WA417_22065, partial [Stellaceae bacterium]